jgi:precorrin-6x reductase
MRTIMLVLSPGAREKYLNGKKIWIEARGYGSEISGVKDQSDGQPDNLGQFLVLGGTTEGRIAAEGLISDGFAVSVSVVRDAGASVIPDGARVLIGARDSPDWTALFADPNIKAGLMGVVDATHPFAADASKEIAAACNASGLPLCRFVRTEELPVGAFLVSKLEDAVKKAIKLTKRDEVIFMAIGTNDLHTVIPAIRKSGRKILVRMLPTVESLRQAERAQVSPTEIVASWGPGGADYNEALCRDRDVKCIVSRESGLPGGVAGKALAAGKLGIPLVLISRPAENPGIVRIQNVGELSDWSRELVSGKSAK